MKINPRSFIVGGLLALALVGAILFSRNQKRAQIAVQQPLTEEAGLRATPKLQGPDAAPVKLVEYSDFECPSCRTVQEDLQGFFKNYPGKIQLAFKHFPLTSHQWSIYAHQAAECMNAQGKFWPYHDKLYEKQAEWARSNVPPVEILARYGREVGADMGRFEKCLADVTVTRTIYAEKEEGNQRQVNATPTFFLGEERFVGPKEMQERGENAIRKILGLPLKPVPEKKTETALPPPPAAAAKPGGS